YMITTQKAPGVISGIQRTENGEMNGKTTYHALVFCFTPIMSGLLESNTTLRWTFEKFFETVQSLREMTTIKLFNCSSGSNNKMYINKTDRFAKCQELIAKETEIAASEQLILYHNREISEVIDMTAEIQNWPKNILHGQLYLYQRERLDQQKLSLPEIRLNYYQHQLLVYSPAPIPQFFSSSPISYDKDERGPQDECHRSPHCAAENRSEECKVYMDVLMNKIYEQEKEAISHCVGCLEEENCMQKAEHLCRKIEEISTAFTKDRKQKTLCPEEEYVHESDRIRIQDLCVQLVSLLQGHCLRNLSRTYSVVGKQIGLLLKNVQRTKKVEQNIASVSDCREKLSNRIDKMDRECLSLAEQAKEGMRTHIKGFSLPVQWQGLSGKPLSPRPMSQDSAFRDSGLGTSGAQSSVPSSSLGARLSQK
ncbi:uncharacterized protein LOC134266636, partial [Saccostrea cucullata]|uniref:uncharacterized protein LOC134266636 n=1 Tax=Saccostrea cuccullata TaxID=36930 RepID=UPI002ED27BFF